MGGKPRAREAEVWHNPRCSKSRMAVERLAGLGVTARVRLYLDDPPSVSELERVLTMLEMEPRELMRQKESVYSELSLGEFSRPRGELLEAMAQNPILIERPVVIHGERAAVGRPVDNIDDLFR